MRTPGFSHLKLMPPKASTVLSNERPATTSWQGKNYKMKITLGPNLQSPLYDFPCAVGTMGKRRRVLGSRVITNQRRKPTFF
jgi:hypothetical protein